MAAASGTGLPSYVPAKYVSLVQQAAQGTGLPAAVVAAQIEEESGFNPNALSPTGAQGMFQFEPGTYKDFGTGSPDNPSDEVLAYIKYMNALLKEEGGDVSKALAAYNAGPGNLAAGAGYAAKILANAKAAAGLTVKGGSGTAAGGGATGATTAQTSAELTSLTGGVEGALNAQSPGTGIGTQVASLLSLPGNVTDLITGAVALIPHVFAIATDVLKALEWLVNPASWMRICAALAGTVLLILGIRQVTAAA